MLSNSTAAEGIIYSIPFVELDAFCLSGLETVGGWYQVIGNGNIFSLTVCSLDVSMNVGISVFTGGCSKLECIEHQSRQIQNCVSGAGKTISFSSTSGTLYKVFVSGLPVGVEIVDFFYVSGNVPVDVFSVRRGLEPGLLPSFERKPHFQIKLLEVQEPENSKCASALPATFEAPIKGNTMGLLTTFKTCQNTEKSGAWYTVEGGVPTDDGMIVYQANTCNSESNFYNTMSIFRGRCESLECANVEVLPCPNGLFGQQVYWSSNMQEDYQIFIHSSDAIEASQYNAGSFQINIAFNNQIPNDRCRAAVDIGIGVFRGSTSGSIPDIPSIENSSCKIGGAGAWYHLMGTGAVFQVSTCSSETDHSTRIQIYSDECGALTCVNLGNGNEAQCDEKASIVNFQTRVDIDYYILVSSRDGKSGNFGLQVSETLSPINNECSAAIPLDEIPSVGSTLQATVDFPVDYQCGLPMNSQGVWYQVEGKGRGIEISTCDSDFESAISVFKGSPCGNLYCITGAIATNRECANGSKGVKASFFGEKDVNYRVYIHGESESPNNAGNFTVSYDEFDVLEANEFCPSAREIPTDGSRVQVSTEDATRASIPSSSCGVEITNPGLWYTFRGNGQPFRITACSEDNVGVDVSVSIFAANSAGCDALTCLTGRTFFENVCSTSQDRPFLGLVLSPNLRFMTEKNKDYYIYVHGTDGVGDFDVFLEEENFASFNTPAPTKNLFRYGKDLHRWIPVDTKALAIHTDYLSLEIVDPPFGNATTEGYIINYIPPVNFSGYDIMTVNGCNNLDCYRFDVTISIMGQSEDSTNEGDDNGRGNKRQLLWLLLLLSLVLIPLGWKYRHLLHPRDREDNDYNDDSSEEDDSVSSFAEDTTNYEKGSLLHLQHTEESVESDSDPSGSYLESSSVVNDDTNHSYFSSSDSYESSSDESSEEQRQML